MNNFQIKLEEKWTTTLSDILGQSQDGPRKNVVYLEDEDEEFVTEFKRAIDNEDVKEADDDNSNDIGIKNTYLNMGLGIHHDDKEGMYQARVKQRAVDQEGRPVGSLHNNPLLDHHQYEVEFLDGRAQIMTANIIAENLLAQVDDNQH